MPPGQRQRQRRIRRASAVVRVARRRIAAPPTSARATSAIARCAGFRGQPPDRPAARRGLAMPAFSNAIAASVWPRCRSWSKRDRRDRGDRRRQDVGGVEAAAEADLDHGDVDAARGGRSRRRSAVETSKNVGVHRQRARRDAARRPRRARRAVTASNVAGVDRRAVDGDALLDAVEVRRGVAAGPQAGGAQRRARPSPRPSPCRWCRRCGSTATRARDGRARRAGCGCCRARA